MKQRCYACHGSAQQMSGLRLDRKEEIIRVSSRIIPRVTGAPGLIAMPPAGPRLTPAEVQTLREWLEQIAPQKKHWAFQPVRKPQPGESIDSLVRARLEREHISPSPEAPKTTLLRRVSLDLTGLPPTTEQLKSFLADSRPDAYQRVVDRLLLSTHFGERWARPWLDRARYADSDGYEKDWVRPYAWRYRQWVIDALNRDMPFDRFTIEQIAGDLLPNATVEQRVATGFHRNTLTNREGGIDNNQFKFEAAVDRANTVAATWMGLTVGCAQCHDHKYDPISQREFYALYAFFDNVNESDIDAPMPGEIGPWLAKRDEYRAKRDALLKEYKVPELQPEWERQMLQAAAEPGKRTDWDLAWDCLLKLTEAGDGEKIMRIPPEKRTERERDVLTTHFIRNYHFAVGNAKWKQLKFDELDKKLRELQDSYPQLTQAMTISETPRKSPAHVRVRGDYRSLGVEVMPGTLAVLPPLKPRGATADRLDLARWLVAPENPLTSRVTVNWVWQELFGRGLVKSVEDFGTRGDAPSHPELLDMLAWRFVHEGWNFKQLVREIVLSATYRQASKARPEVDAMDPDNALLSRQERLRLPAELIRDEALFAAGLLDLRVGGKSVRPPQPAGVAAMGYGKKDDSWVESKGADRYRRGLYIQFQRATPYPLMVNFDAPRTTVAQCRRDRSNTALQALNLLNDPAFLEAAQALAYETRAADSPDLRITAMFERALGRDPSDAELPRFRAAQKQMDWTALASVVLNLDEFITRE